MERYGPAGGVGAEGDKYDHEGTKISFIDVRGDHFIESIRGKFSDGSDLPTIGGAGLEIFPKLQITEPEEFLVRIEGTCHNFINSITFFTNKGQRVDCIGRESGSNFFEFGVPSDADSLENAEIHIVGFWGRAAQFVDAIGVIIDTIPKD